jgi:hypothetical protein
MLTLVPSDRDPQPWVAGVTFVPGVRTVHRSPLGVGADCAWLHLTPRARRRPRMMLTDDPAVEQAVVRLADEFRTRLRPQVIGTVVRTCRQDLSGVPATALPEMVERLARERLQSVG